MKKIITSCFTVVVVFGLLTACTNRQMGTTTGAVIGGVAGNVLTDGSGLGTVAGAAAGGLIGNQVTR